LVEPRFIGENERAKGMGEEGISDHRLELFIERAELGDRRGRVVQGEGGEGSLDAEDEEGLDADGFEGATDDMERVARWEGGGAAEDLEPDDVGIALRG
jgi:hypothetical protein